MDAIAEFSAFARAMRPARAGPGGSAPIRASADGAMLFDSDGIFFVPAFPLEDEVDPTGAGDTFAGALLGQLAQLGTVDGGSTRRALLMAATVASYCVEGVGTTRVESLTLKQVDPLIRQLTLYRDLVDRSGDVQ